MTDNDKLGRRMGVRVAFVLAATAAFFATLFVITTYGTTTLEPETVRALSDAGVTLTPDQITITVLDQEMVWSALEWLVGMFSLAILGDTARPSGKKTGAFGVVTNGVPASKTE